MIPKEVNEIGNLAFPVTTKIFCYKGSCAEWWAIGNVLAYEYIKDVPVTGLTLNMPVRTLTVTSRVKHPTYHLSVKKVQPSGVMMPDIKWISDNRKVAKVDANGLVTAVAPGEATITATAKDGSGVKTTCKITVENQKVKSFNVVQEGKTRSLKGKTVTLKKGKTLQLQIKKLKPSTAVNQKITYKSSNKKIVSISSKGLIKALRKGTATITVQSKDKGYKITFRVRVK